MSLPASVRFSDSICDAFSLFNNKFIYKPRCMNLYIAFWLTNICLCLSLSLEPATFVLNVVSLILKTFSLLLASSRLQLKRLVLVLTLWSLVPVPGNWPIVSCKPSPLSLPTPFLSLKLLLTKGISTFNTVLIIQYQWP